MPIFLALIPRIQKKKEHKTIPARVYMNQPVIIFPGIKDMNESIITTTYSLKLGYEICGRIQKLKDDEHERKKKNSQGDPNTADQRDGTP